LRGHVRGKNLVGHDKPFGQDLVRKLSGWRKAGSGRRRSSRNKRWVISSTPVRSYP
jgi:hypothetical protein